MALITQRICDHKEAHGDDLRVDATEHEYMIDGKKVKIDQCPPCAQPYQDMFSDLLLIGRSTPLTAEEKPKRVKPWKPPAGDTLDRPFVCPFCDKARYTSLGRLAPHIGRQHKEHAAAWREQNGLKP